MPLWEKTADVLGLNRLFLRKGKHEIDPRSEILTSPADCRVACIAPVEADGRIREKNLFGGPRHLFLEDHLAGLIDPKAFLSGQYVNLYLSPLNLHYLLWPVSGRLSESKRVPGKCYPLIFCRSADVVNEKVITLLETSFGFPMVMILVGSFLVCGIRMESTIGRAYAKGEQFGCFKLGSTVILVLPPDCATFLVSEGQRLRLGQALAEVAPSYARQATAS